MHMRSLRFAFWLLLPVFALLIGVNGARAQGDPRQLCVSDAIRLCNDFIPDAEKVKRCMLSKRGQLSAECRNSMHSYHRGGGRYYHRGARPRHYKGSKGGKGSKH
jgi:hypothetical protein